MTSYNGWTNYETWAVNLWITDEQSTSEYWTEAAADQMRRARMYPDKTLTVSEDARLELSKLLKDELTDAAPDLGGTLYGDLLNAALSEVDWDELADSLLSEIDGYEPRS